jgi:aerobic carbon-monoxide dehydrogenase medium subunit
MMLAPFDYAAPKSVAEAVKALSTTADSRPLGGGHGLLNAMKLSRRGAALLVDLCRIRELHGVSEVDGAVRIGAATTLGEVVDSPTLRDRQPVLARAAAAAVDAQVRNRATVGGTLASRLAASDLAAALLLVDATVGIAGPTGERVVSLDDFYAANGPALTAGEIITSVTVPAAATAKTETAYLKVSDRATLQPICGLAAGVTVGRDGKFKTVRLAVTGATHWPTRLRAAEQALTGTRAPVETGSLPVGPAEAFVDDASASATYRAHLTRVLIGRALARASGPPA